MFHASILFSWCCVLSDAGDRKQFINTPQIVSFTTSGSNEIIPVQIAILDDGIIGPDVQFVCIVELVNQSFASAVNISSPVTLVRIIDNDGKSDGDCLTEE